MLYLISAAHKTTKNGYSKNDKKTKEKDKIQTGIHLARRVSAHSEHEKQDKGDCKFLRETKGLPYVVF